MCMLKLSCQLHAVDVYVSPDGDDLATGAQNEPVASLQRAQDLARSYAGKEAVTVHFADGIYYLPETLVLSSQDSGKANMAITYQAENEGGAVLSGGSELKLEWTHYKDGIYQAVTPEGLVIDQLFIDGRNQRMARYPNHDPEKKAEPYQGYSADAFSKERAANWSNPVGAYIHAMHRAGWGGYHYRITGKDAQGEVIYEGGWQNNRQMGMHKEHRMVENVFEELDAAHEWYHDTQSNKLYFKPGAGTDLQKAKVEVVRLRHLIEFRGTEKNPVKYITLKGFVVRHAARTFMDTKEPLLRSDWTIYRGGAYLLTGTEHIEILDTEFDQVGGNAIFVSNYNRNVTIRGCHIHNTGGSGVAFVGDPAAVRNPLFEYGQRNDLSTVDRTVGPKTNNYPADCFVEDCLIHGIGRTERQPAGVQISMAMGITVRDTSVYDTARAGINVSEGTWGGHLIERVDVFDTVLETHDHGSFNSWGRDRFWRADHLSASQKAVDVEPELPFLDAFQTTIIRNSRWRCDHGWDIDLDDGSSNYHIYNNLMLKGGLKLREGFGRHAWNNITVNSGLHPHVWFQRSQDQVYSNIFMRPHAVAQMTVPYDDLTRVDRNFFASNSASVLDVSKVLAWDGQSIYGDPNFVNPQSGDYRVKDGSPALKMGFENFPMDQFGVKKASLKAIARTPLLPAYFLPAHSAIKIKPVEIDTRVNWLGATLSQLSGEEFSAYGVSKESGGLAVSMLQADGALMRAGIKNRDLIQKINGRNLVSVADLTHYLAGQIEESYLLSLVRDQRQIEVPVVPDRDLHIEFSSQPNGFSRLTLPTKPTLGSLSTNLESNNEPLNSLLDGRLVKNFGPVFANSVYNGLYKLDLGAVQPVQAITSWTYNMSGARGKLKLNIYASDSESDPGWDLSQYAAVGTIDTTGLRSSAFTAASMRARSDKLLGKYRWIVWAVFPVTGAGGGENTAFQEFSVDLL